MTDMQYSPKLKGLMKQIETIMNEAGVGGAVMLYEPQICEFKMMIEPPFSVARTEQVSEGLAIRIRSKLVDYNGDKDKQEIALANTIDMLGSIQHFGGIIFSQCDMVLAQIKKVVDFDFNSGDVRGAKDTDIDNPNYLQ